MVKFPVGPWFVLLARASHKYRVVAKVERPSNERRGAEPGSAAVLPRLHRNVAAAAEGATRLSGD
jgi:hypothetical protein